MAGLIKDVVEPGIKEDYFSRPKVACDLFIGKCYQYGLKGDVWHGSEKGLLLAEMTARAKLRMQSAQLDRLDCSHQ